MNLQQPSWISNHSATTVLKRVCRIRQGCCVRWPTACTQIAITLREIGITAGPCYLLPWLVACSVPARPRLIA